MRKIITFFIIFLAFSNCMIAQKQKSVAYGSNDSAGRYYDIRGIKMYAEVYGEGQPLLIIHGNGGSIADFVFQIPYFMRSYKVIIADSRSQGKSTDMGDSLSYEMMADDYDALLTKMNIDSANVIGWSDGGIEGLLLAIRHPAKVKKLAVTGANLWPDTTAVYPEVLNMVKPMYSKLKKSHLTADEKTQWKLVRLLIDEPHIPLTDLKKIQCPSLIIGGDHDVIKEEHTMLIYKNIPQAYLWILPNSGHSTPIVYKDEFNTTIDKFFLKPFRKIEKGGRFN
jgi:pimeloyl-ACP methyl ester carboxylesterase